MTAEALSGAHELVIRVAEGRSKASTNMDPASFIEYPACGGRPASSPTNWVPADWLGYHLASILRVTDEDLKKKKEK